jgi:hypothetical protein
MLSNIALLKFFTWLRGFDVYATLSSARKIPV